MAGQIEVNEKVTKIKAKQSELSANAAAGKAELASATSKLTELKSEMTDLIPEIPEVPSIQGELSKLGSVSEGGFIAKIGALVTQYGSAIPGLSSLLGTMGLSSFPPTISVSSIRDQIPNVEEVDGALVTQPQEPEVPEEPPEAPIEKEETEIDYEEISNTILKSSVGAEFNKMYDHASIGPPMSLTQARAIIYVWKYNWWTSFGEQGGVSDPSLYISYGSTEKADRYTALYTVADSNMVFKGVKTTYIERKGEHKESADLLDFADVCNYWWEKKQKNA